MALPGLLGVPREPRPREWGTPAMGCLGSSVPGEWGTHTMGCLKNRVPREWSTHAGSG